MLKIGDFVLIKDLNKFGKIVSINKKQAQVLVNSLIFKTELNNIEIKKETKFKVKPIIKKKYFKKEKAPDYIDLHGHFKSEALNLLENYISKALIADLDRIRIITGIGDQIIFNEVNSFLKNKKYVKKLIINSNNQGEIIVLL